MIYSEWWPYITCGSCPEMFQGRYDTGETQFNQETGQYDTLWAYSDLETGIIYWNHMREEHPEQVPAE